MTTTRQVRIGIEYDTHKNQTNIRKHGISIPELATIFKNPFIKPAMDIPDVKHSQREKRFWAYGWTRTGWYEKIGIHIGERRFALSVAGS